MSKRQRDSNLWLGATTVTLAIIGFPIVFIGHITYCDNEGLCASFFQKFITLPPNAIGDTLAGIFGPLAFLAAAVAIILQSSELRAQRLELELTRNEYRRNREATEKMAISLEAQTSTSQVQRESLVQETQRRILEEMIRNLHDFCKKEISPTWSTYVWSKENGNAVPLYEDSDDFDSYVSLFPDTEGYDDFNLEEFCQDIYEHAQSANDALILENVSRFVDPLPSSDERSVIITYLTRLEEIVSHHNRASVLNTLWAKRLNLLDTYRLVKEISEREFIWQPQELIGVFTPGDETQS